jgi:hypothetical protein
MLIVTNHKSFVFPLEQILNITTSSHTTHYDIEKKLVIVSFAATPLTTT